LKACLTDTAALHSIYCHHTHLTAEMAHTVAIYWQRSCSFLEWPPGRRNISRITDHISSPPQDTPVQEVFSRLLAGHQLNVSGGHSSSSTT